MVPDHVAIFNLIGRYAELFDSGDFDGVGALLTRAQFSGMRGGPFNGAEEIAAELRATVPLHDDGLPWQKHITTNMQLEMLDGGKSARCQSVFTVLHEPPGTRQLRAIAVGRYFDEFAYDNDWYFTSRKRIRDLTGMIDTDAVGGPHG